MGLTIQRIRQRHLDRSLRHIGCSKDMLHAACQLRDCRTAAMGHHVDRCPQGHYEKVRYNSCRQRSCPQCSALTRERWLAGWKCRLLPCPHHHIVFTTPQELVPLWRYNKEVFASTLFAAASETLMQLLDAPKYLGARPRLLTALHTWSQKLLGHVHLHVLVTAGGLDAQGVWRQAVKSCLLPRKVLMIKFRGKFRAMLLSLLRRQQLNRPPGTTPVSWRSLLNRLGRVVWNVKLLERYEHGYGVATYLAHYLKGGPIGSKRLISDRDGQVKFRYRQPTKVHGEKAQQGRIELPAHMFIERLLEHVPPRSFQTIRGYGLYSGNQHSHLPEAHVALGQEPLPKNTPPLSWQDYCEAMGRESSCRCATCGSQLVTVRSFAPPEAVTPIVSIPIGAA